MGPLEQIIHVFNFIAPAWGVAVFGVLAARVGVRWGLPLAPWGWFMQTLVSGLVGTMALVSGLVLGGVDAKMTTYTALVLSCATTQWVLCKGWRR